MCRGIFTKLRPCHLSKPIAEPHNWNDGDVKIERSVSHREYILVQTV